MKLGIKVNADADGFTRLREARPDLAEVWFNINKKDDYSGLFDELKRQRCDVGLHFWGMLDGGVSPNLAYPDEANIKSTMSLMCQTIDVAAQNHFQYVNIHPGMRAKTKVNFALERYDLLSDPVDEHVATGTFLEHAKKLHEYAKAKNVVFTVETVPPRITRGWYGADTRLTPYNIYELPVSAILQAAGAGLWVANDFVHTAANIMTDDPSAVWTFLHGVTGILEPQTRLIHLGFVIPPYNGTDHHGMLNDPLLDTDQAVPNKEQMMELLKPFKTRDDVWILVEPSSDHVKNYFWAKDLIHRS